MKGMVLAAGLGSRLRPLTNDRPKALVELAGRTLLEITLCRLRGAGIRQVIVNVHHFADMMAEYLREHDYFGMEIELSREDDALLDTGGGLRKAAGFFLRDGTDEPFLLHNVDVISNIDLAAMLRQHTGTSALATLAVQRRDSSRYLLFGPDSTLCGRRFVKEDRTVMVRRGARVDELAFSGIHVISPRMLGMMSETGVFSIIDTYLRLAAEGERIEAFRADAHYWRDLGKAESLDQAARDIAQGLILVD